MRLVCGGGGLRGNTAELNCPLVLEAFGVHACARTRANSVCLSQDHKYVVRAEVLSKSWQLDEAELTFVQQLRESQRNEMRGEVNNS